MKRNTKTTRPRPRPVARRPRDDGLPREPSGPRSAQRTKAKPYDPVRQRAHLLKPSYRFGREQENARVLRWSYYWVLNSRRVFRRALLTLAEEHATMTANERSRLVRDFAHRWYLPRRFGTRDLEWSLAEWAARRRGSAPTISVGPRPMTDQNPRRMPSRLRERAHLAYVGRCIYLRNIRGWTWERITRFEARVRGQENLDLSSVAQTARREARRLGIPLREFPRGRRALIGK